jgi:hypothetical protein
MAVPLRASDPQQTAARRAEALATPFDSSPRGRLPTSVAAVVARDGYRNATVARVLAHARMSWEDFTAEFESLEECFLATQSAAMECAVVQAEQAIDETDRAAAPEAPFDAALNRLLTGIAAHRDLARLALVESSSLGAKGMERREAGLQRFVLLLQRLADRAGASVPPIAAEMVAGGIYEILQRKVAADDLDRPAELAGELRRLWLPLIRVADASR